MCNIMSTTVWAESVTTNTPTHEIMHAEISYIFLIISLFLIAVEDHDPSVTIEMEEEE